MREKMARALTGLHITTADGSLVKPELVIDAILDAMREPSEGVIEAVASVVAEKVSNGEMAKHTAIRDAEAKALVRIMAMIDAIKAGK